MSNAADGGAGEARHRWVVEPEPGENRLDRYLAARLSGLSRTRIVKLIEAERVRVNGAVPKKSAAPEPGDEVEVTVPPPEPSPRVAEPLPLDIIYQDEDLLVVNKAAGMVVHPAPGHRRGTLVNALLWHVDDLSGIGGVLRPGIVHRLDKDTSGLLVVAKTDAAHRRLAGALERRAVGRTYLAASWGHLDNDERTVDAPIGRSPADRQRMAVTADGRRAVTHLRRLERWLAADLLRVTLETGRTHQIRVHLASLGHPVIADETYGAGGARGMSGPVRGFAEQLERRVPRQFLHAAELRFRHPTTGAELRFESALPPPLAEAAEWARAASMPASSSGT